MTSPVSDINIAHDNVHHFAFAVSQYSIYWHVGRSVQVSARQRENPTRANNEIF